MTGAGPSPATTTGCTERHVVACVHAPDRWVVHVDLIQSERAPAATGDYSQAVRLREVSELLFVSGQVPEDVAGVVPDDFVDQCRLAWSNVIAQLEAAGMTVADIVKVTTFPALGRTRLVRLALGRSPRSPRSARRRGRRRQGR